MCERHLKEEEEEEFILIRKLENVTMSYLDRYTNLIKLRSVLLYFQK